MVRQRYTALGPPEQAAAFFETLRPMYEQLAQARLRCRPFSAEFHALSVPCCALEATAVFFTRQRYFYSAVAGDATTPPPRGDGE